MLLFPLQVIANTQLVKAGPISIWTYSQNLAAVAEVPSLKVTSAKKQ